MKVTCLHCIAIFVCLMLIRILSHNFNPKWSSYFLLLLYINYNYKALRTLRAHLLFRFWTFSLCVHCKRKTNQKFHGIKKNFVDFQNFQESNFVTGKFLKIRSSLNFPWSHVRSHKSFKPDRFSRLLKTNDSQSKYIYRYTMIII